MTFNSGLPYKLLYTILLVIVMILFYTTLSILKSEVEHHSTIASNVEVLVLENKDLPNRSTWWKEDCFFHNCFEINECQYTDPPDRIKVYIYPDYRYSLPDHGNIQLPVSKEYKEILDTIYDSVYYEPSPVEACVFIPSIDTLNQRTIDVSLVTKLLSRLPWWNSGTNHIIFSMLPGQHPTYNVTPDFLYDKAILAGSQFNTISYRIGFDLAIPVYNSLTKQDIYLNNIIGNRKYLLSVLIQLGADPAVISRIQTNERVLLLGPCKQCDDCWIKKRCGLKHGVEHSWNYPQVLQESNFCLILPGHRHEVSDLLDILMMGCIPVIVRDYQFMLPFSEVLDWSLPAVFVWIEELNNLMDILKPVQLNDKQIFVNFFYHRYFNSIKAITMTTLDVLNGRVFPITGHSYEYWNVPDEDFQHKLNSKIHIPNSLTLPSSQPHEGFTAVILAYNRVNMLFKTILSISKAPSLSKILVIWNNVYEPPPATINWPHISQPIQLIKMKHNRLSNRFYPYPEIETAAVLSLDDDIVMMSGDEIEFGYKVWLEFPNCLVGYPGRVHSYNSKTNYFKYYSEWTNNISVVLTGASFYHQYYNYQYTYALPSVLRKWVDEHFNCEDIVFNFMVANITGLPSIKVTPRKRFKCPECTNTGLYVDPSHFLKRDECFNLFAKYFKGVSLKTTYYRLDPVLYKVNSIPDKQKVFPNIGTL